MSNDNSTVEDVMVIVNGYESTDKSYLIEDLLNLLTPEQSHRVLHCLKNHLPINVE